MKTTTFVEERVYKSAGGYLKISCCYLCGARVKQITIDKIKLVYDTLGIPKPNAIISIETTISYRDAIQYLTVAKWYAEQYSNNIWELRSKNL